MGAIKEWMRASRAQVGRFIAGAPSGAPAPHDDYWYQPYRAGGKTITEDMAISITTIDAGVSLISDSIASLPLPIYERLDSGERREARSHPLWPLLNSQPNSWQTAVDFWANRLVDLLMCGNAYAEIQPNSRTFVGSMTPLRADRMRVMQIDDGSIIYEYSEPGGVRRRIDEELVFHIRNTQSRDNGLTGTGLLDKHVQSIALQLAIQTYASQLYSQGTMHMGVLTHPGEVGDESLKRLRAQWQENQGVAGAGKPIIVEDGMTWESTSMTPESAEVLDSRKFHVEESCRMLRVPPHLLGHTEKNSSWGTGMADLKAGFLQFTLRPYLERFEQAISRDLIEVPRKYFPEWNVDGLLRADIKTRYEVYAIGRQWGLLTANEPRRKENLPSLEGGDTLISPLNMGPVTGQETNEMALGRSFVRDAARKQADNERKWIEANASEFEDPGFRSKVYAYFDKRRSTLVKSLHISDSAAEDYAKYASFTLIEACEQGKVSEMTDEWTKSAERALVAAIYRQIS